MADGRLNFAVEAGLELPAEGTVAVIGAPGGMDLSALPQDRLSLVQPFAPEAAALESRGLTVDTDLPDSAAAVVVVLPRARERGESWVAAAERAAGGGLVVVDGAKTDGVEALLKAVRARVPVEGQISKAHGKVFWFAAGSVFSDWAHPPRRLPSGFMVSPGAFSADGPDPASEALLAALPDRIGGTVADLGAGWGFLSAALIERPGLTALHMVEADRDALDCARANVPDPRAQAHWADATRWRPSEALDAVVMNPPFHSGRAPDPGLGRAFIANAARILKPSGRLWLVANRHLPYEAALESHFRETAETGGDRKFKILAAARPKPPAL